MNHFGYDFFIVRRDMKKVAKCAKKQGCRLTILKKIERIISDMIFALLEGT